MIFAQHGLSLSVLPDAKLKNPEFQPQNPENFGIFF
jgi:hypothetical protein